MNNGAITFVMRPKSLKLRIEAKRLRLLLMAQLPQEDDEDIRAAIEGKAHELVLLLAHTESIKANTDNPDVLAFVQWWNNNDAPLLQRFDGFIATPDVILINWWEAYEGADQHVLTVATKPPHLLTPEEKAALDDPKAPKPKPAGVSSSGG